jgi:hypothetical protein
MTTRILNAPLMLSFTLDINDITRIDDITFSVVLRDIAFQSYSPPEGSGVQQYNGLNVRVGYWISTRILGKAYQIKSINTVNTTVSEVYCTVTDVDGYIAAISEDRLNFPGDGAGFIFTTNEDGDPILTPGNPSGIISDQWQGDIISHFSARRHKSQYVSIYQSDGTTVTAASISDNNTNYEVASTTGFTVGNTVIIEGIEVEEPAAGYNGTGTIQTISSNIITVNIKSDGTPTSFTGATLRIGSISRGRDFVVGESIYIDSTGIFRKSAGSEYISDTVGIVTSKGIPSDDWFSFRPSGKYFDTTVFPNDFFPTSANVVGSVALTPGLKLYINPNGATPQYTSVAPTSNPYATWVIIGQGTSSATTWSDTESYAQYAYVEHNNVYYFSINAITLDEDSPVQVSPDLNNTDWIPANWNPGTTYVSGTPTFYLPTETFYISQGGAVGDIPSSTSSSWTKTNNYSYPSANRAIYIAGSGGGGGGSNTTVVTGTVQVFDGGGPEWASAPPEVIYPVLDCGGEILL